MKIKVTIVRAEYREHTFEYEVEDPDQTTPEIAVATAKEQAMEDAYDFDFNDGTCCHDPFYEVTSAVVES